ncbi:hypothetical protein D9M73_196970 [compost metagenome]
MTAIRRQLVDAAHDQLPLFAVGADAWAEHLVGDQVGDFVGDGLLEEMLAVLAVQLRVEAQQVFLQVRDPGLLPAQPEVHLRAGEAAFEEAFRLLVAGFDAGVELFGHVEVSGSGRLCRR